jgi:hypothetical protein
MKITKEDVEYLCELSYYIWVKIGENKDGNIQDKMFNASLLCSVDYDYDVFAEFCIYLYDYAVSVQAERKEPLIAVDIVLSRYLFNLLNTAQDLPSDITWPSFLIIHIMAIKLGICLNCFNVSISSWKLTSSV